MISINNIIVEKKHFPDNSQMLLDVKTHIFSDNVVKFRWVYESDEELVTLYYLVKHIDNINIEGVKLHKQLILSYIPNARMDRVKSSNEVFTLKYFAEFINSLSFEKVEVFDAHSDVSLALLSNVLHISPKVTIQTIIDTITKFDSIPPILYFPDAGTKKRYSYIYEDSERSKVCFGEKVREWKTGKILGLDIETDGQDIDFKDKTVLMIDDIISYGGTMYYSAKKLKELGVKDIYIYCSHLENSVLDEERGTLIKLLNDGTITKLYTTNSLFTEKHPSIAVAEVF